jgi:hypothetical protein
MTALTVFHTAISVLPIGLGMIAFARDGKIDPKTRLGKLYLATMMIGSVSSFGFIPALGFTPGQVFTLITLSLLFAGTFTLRGHVRGPGYIQTIGLSASYFMLMIFATTETLKRFPINHPFASGPTDPSLIPVRLMLLVLFVTGITYQAIRVHSANRLFALKRVIAA